MIPVLAFLRNEIGRVFSAQGAVRTSADRLVFYCASPMQMETAECDLGPYQACIAAMAHSQMCIKPGNQSFAIKVWHAYKKLLVLLIKARLLALVVKGLFVEITKHRSGAAFHSMKMMGCLPVFNLALMTVNTLGFYKRIKCEKAA